MQDAIVTCALRRAFGTTEAVRGIDLAVPTGSIYGFLGPNGAGKTTTIRMLLGLLRPSGGTIRILGRAMPQQRLTIARAIGALVETQSLYDHLTGRENLEISRSLLRLPRSATEPVLDIVDLVHAADEQVRGYSLGMRQRLVIARALLGAPRLLILDEPANGLDPDGIRDLRDLLRRLTSDGRATVLVSSHQLAEVEQIATHVGLMHAGRLLTQGRIGEVLSRERLQMEIEVDRAAEARALLESEGLEVARSGDRLLAQAGGSGFDAPAIAAKLVASGFRLSSLRTRDPTLEDLYVTLTRAAA